MPPRKKATSKPKAPLSPEVIVRIRADVERWKHGLWAKERPELYGPACTCGLRRTGLRGSLGDAWDGRCSRHDQVA